MFSLTLLLTLYYVHFTTSFQTGGGLVGFVFGFQRICLCRCGVSQRILSDPLRTGRLLGGEAMHSHQFPWLALVHAGDKTFGGSLISDRHVLTAASMLYGLSPNNVTVTLGAHDRCVKGDALTSSVASLTIHPGFTSTTLDNDLALLMLRHALTFSQFISPICLPFFSSKDAGQVAYTSSWSEGETTFTCTPRTATLPILPTRSCFKSALDNKLVTADKSCLGPVGAKSIICKSDAGSPVMTRWSSGGSFRLVGVISSSSCDHPAAPLFTRVIDHIGWINEKIRNDCQCF